MKCPSSGGFPWKIESKMFKNEFQGGPFVEVFSSQGKEPLAKWKVSGGPSVQKIFDKEVKSYIHTLEGASATTKIQLPKDTKQTLGLTQHYLVLQISIPLGSDFSLELGITDMGNSKRRVFFSTAQKEISATPLHAKIPLTVLRRPGWLNFCVDLVSVVAETFRGQTYKSLDSITISAACRIRKIFTMKSQPVDDTDDDELYDVTPCTNETEVDSIPKACQFAIDVPHQTQVLTMTKLKHAELKIRGDQSRPPSTEQDLNSSMRSKDDRPMHIAFGTKVPVPGTAERRKVSATGQREGSTTSRTSKSSHSSSQRSEDPPPSARTQAARAKQVDMMQVHPSHTRQKSDPGSDVSESRHNDKGTLQASKTWSAGTTNLKEDSVPFQPHPPREKSAEKSRRIVRVRPSSGKKESDSGRESEKDPMHSDDSCANKQVYTSRTQQKSYDRKKYSDKGRKMQEDDMTNKNTANGSPEDSQSRRTLEKSRVGQTGLRTSQEPRVYNSKESYRLPRGRNDSESSDKDSGVVSMSSRGNSVGKKKGQGDSMSESDDVNAMSGSRKDFKSRIPRRKKRSERSLNLMNSLSENEEVQYSNGRNGKSSMITNSGQKGAPGAVSSRTESSGDRKTSDNQLDEADSATSTRQSSQLGSGLYTFMSPPRSAPLRTLERENHIDPHKLQKKLQMIKETTSQPSAQVVKNGTDSDSMVHPPPPVVEDNFSNIHDESYGMEPYMSISKRKSHPEDERNMRLETNGSDYPVKESSDGQPHRSQSPTLRKWKLAAADEDESYLQKEKQRISFHASTKDIKPRISQISPRGAGALSRMSISSKKLKEIPKTDPRLSDDYDWRKYNSNTSSLASSLEANMLASLRRQQIDELYEDDHKQPGVNNSFDLHNYGDDDLSSSSDDTMTTYSTWKPPDPSQRAHKFQDEMHFPTSTNPMLQSNPRDWGNLFSPPIVLPSEKMREESLADQLSPGKENPPGSGVLYNRQPSSGSDTGKVGSNENTDGEEELDLLYDPCLNCYFDPKTGKYYELA